MLCMIAVLCLQGRLLPSIFGTHWRVLIPSTCLKLVTLGLMFASPLLLQQLMEAVEAGQHRGTRLYHQTLRHPFSQG